MCSSFEVLAGLCMSEEEFMKEKELYIKEVLDKIAKAALNEARLLLDTHQKTGEYLTEISDKISERINYYKYQLLDYLKEKPLPKNPKDPLIRALYLYCPPIIQTKYWDRIETIPDIHKKAMIACFLASHLVYTRGVEWGPNIADILPTLSNDPILSLNS